MFPDDFFGNQDHKTNNFNKKVDHPKLLNPQMIPQNKNNQIHVIKEELLEESTETFLPKKNGLQIIIPQDSSNDDNSTESSRTLLTPITPNIKTNFYYPSKLGPCSVIDCKTSTNSLKDNELTRPITIKEKNINQKNGKNDLKKQTSKGKIRSVSSKRRRIEKTNNATTNKDNDTQKRNKSESRYLKNKQSKNNNVVRTIKRQNTVEINRKKDVKNNKNKSSSCPKKNNNRSEGENKKNNQTNIIHQKVEKEIDNIFKNLPEDYEIIPEIKNKFELLLKNINDFKDVIYKKTQNNFRPRKSRFEKNSH